MATILRSSKYIRHFAGFARRLVLNHSNGDVAGNLLSQSQGVSAALANNLATNIALEHAQYESTLERSLHKIDQDVRRFGRIFRRDLEDALREIQTQKSATTSQALMLIRGCGNLASGELPEVRRQLVKEIWTTLENLGIPMDVSHYNALLRVYLENEHVFSPVEFLTELEKKGIEPNRVTYQRLITRYCQQGDIEGATRILEFMREKQMPVNEYVFNALIMGHSQTNDMESAVGILGVMQQANMEPSADTYNTLLCGYGKIGDIESIKRVLSECQSKDILLLDKDLMDVIYSLVSNGHTEHVDELLSAMTKGYGYNNDAVNLILKLVNIGKEDVAMKILMTMQKPLNTANQPGTLGSFYIKQLVKINVPVEKIIEVCQHLQKEHNTRAFAIALEASLLKGDLDQAIPLLHAWKENGAEIRQHYFWPLIAAQGNLKNNDGILQIIQIMSNEFGLSVSNETLRDYVVPLYDGTIEDIQHDLRTVGISPGSSTSAILFHLISKNKMKEAAVIASESRSYHPPNLFRRPLLLGLAHTEDIKSFIIIFRRICENLSKQPKNNDDDLNDISEVVGATVNDIPYYIKKNTVEILTAVLKGLAEGGLGMTSAAAKKLENRLGEQFTPELAKILSILTSGTLVPKPVSVQSSRSQDTSLASVPRLQQLIATIESKGESANGIKRQLLNVYCRNKDVEGVEQLLKELETQDFSFTTGVYSQLLDLYTNLENLEMAEKYMNKIKSTSEENNLDEMKLLKYVALLAANQRFDDAMQLLETHKQNRNQDELSYLKGAICWKILKRLAEAGDVDHLKQFFDILTKHGYVEITNNILSLLVKVHIVRNDLKSALDTFEWACETHKCTPHKNELTIQLIGAEDASSLQRLTDLSTKIHGEVNSLYDLLLSFVECGRHLQAKKILENPGLGVRSRRIYTVAARYRQEGMITPLENLVEITKDLYHIDRTMLYNELLQAYSIQDNWEQGLGLWMKMQEENVQSSDEFLQTLADLLKRHNQPVPFAEPQRQTMKPQEKGNNVSEKQIKENDEPITSVQQFRRSLRNGNIDAALSARTRIEAEGKTLTVTDSSSLMEAFVQKGQLNEAIRIAEEMIKAGLYPTPRTFKFLMAKVSESGDTESLEKFQNILPLEVKKMISFNTKYFRAYIRAGRSEELLNKLEKDIDDAKEEDLETLKKQFPRGGCLELLVKCPHMCEKYEDVARKYFARGLLTPMNVLWMNQFLENKPKADEIWDQYLANYPKLMVESIIRTAIKNNNVELLERLARTMKTSPISDQMKGNIHSCILKMYNKLEKYDEGLQVLEKAVKDVSLESIHRATLVKLREGVEKDGKSFPYTIPPKNAKNTSSSSSDDENITQQSKQ